MTDFGEVQTPTPLEGQVVLIVDNFRMGVTQPRDDTIGTSPTVPTIRFSRLQEKLSLVARMPLNWDRNFDITMNLDWALANLQSPGDELNITIDYTVAQNVLAQSGVGVTRASSQTTGAFICVVGKLQPFDTYRMAIVFDRDDTSNPTTPPDVSAIAFEIGLANLDGVDEAHFLGGCILYLRQN